MSATVTRGETRTVTVPVREFIKRFASELDDGTWIPANNAADVTIKLQRDPAAGWGGSPPGSVTLHIDGQHVECEKFRFETPRHVHYICDGPLARERILGTAGFCIVITGPKDPWWWSDRKPHAVTICSADKMLHVQTGTFTQAGNGDYFAVMQDGQPAPTWKDLIDEWRSAHVVASLEKARAEAAAAKQRGIVAKNPDGTWKFVPDEDRKPKLGGPGKRVFKMEVPADLGSSGDDQIDRFINGMIQIFRQSLPDRGN